MLTDLQNLRFAKFTTQLVTQIELAGCHRAFLMAIKGAKWIVVRDEPHCIVCRQPNSHGHWIEDLVTIEFTFSALRDRTTKIDVNGSSGRTGTPAHTYVRHQSLGMIRRVDTLLRPQPYFPPVAQNA